MIIRTILRRMADDAFRLNPARDPRTSSEPTRGVPLYETANRTQVELTPTDLETLLPPGHAARLVWRFVEGLDLTRFMTRSDRGTTRVAGPRSIRRF